MTEAMIRAAYNVKPTPDLRPERVKRKPQEPLR